jgi:hypothetical protein
MGLYLWNVKKENNTYETKYCDLRHIVSLVKKELILKAQTVLDGVIVTVKHENDENDENDKSTPAQHQNAG